MRNCSEKPRNIHFCSIFSIQQQNWFSVPYPYLLDAQNYSLHFDDLIGRYEMGGKSNKMKWEMVVADNLGMNSFRHSGGLQPRGKVYTN